MPLQADLREARSEIEKVAHAGDTDRLPIVTYWTCRLLDTYTPHMAKAAGMGEPDEAPPTGYVKMQGASVACYAGISYNPSVAWLLTDVPLVDDSVQYVTALADATGCSDLVICAPAVSPEVMMAVGQSWHHGVTFLAHHADDTLSMLYQVVK